MSFSLHEIRMLQGKTLSVGLFPCGHAKRPSNAYVIMKAGELYIRCTECHNEASARCYAARAEKTP